MSVHVNYYDWNSAEECLQWLFENHEDMKNRGSILVWQEYFAVGFGCMKAGSYKALTPSMLKDRNYKAFFADNSVSIFYYDEIVIDIIPNRTYPDQKASVISKLPYI
jgi:hypothetical protein